MEQIAVLGCGPAGLLAAHAVVRGGKEPIIFSRKQKSPIGGAQYLHRSIPGISPPEEAEVVTFVKTGSGAVYAKKVYGDMSAKTSWDEYSEGDHKVWNMRDAYARLWREYESQIVDTEINPAWVEATAKDMEVVSSVPLKAICPEPERYYWHSQPVWIEYGQNIYCEAGDMEIIYSGRKAHEWYRSSNIFGWKGVEWPRQEPGAVEITKPLSSTFPGVPGVLPVGRYGKWKKGELIHHAYEDVLDYMGVWETHEEVH